MVLMLAPATETVVVSGCQPPVLSFDLSDLGEHLRRCPLDAFIWCLSAAVKFQDPVGYSIMVHSPPAARKGLVVTPVKRAIDLPTAWDFKWLNNVCPLPVLVVLWPVCKLFEELTFVNIPPAVQPSFTDLWRQLLSAPHT